MIEAPKFTVMNGNLTPYEDSRIHVMAPAITYAASVFEGIRGYWNGEEERLYLFRLDEHLERLQFSMRLMRFEDPPSSEVLRSQMLRLVKANGFRADIYIRLAVYVDGDGMVASTGPIGYSIVARLRGRGKNVDAGLNCAVSSWRRMSDNAIPPRVKATGNYLNSRLSSLQVKKAGYDFPILLTERGTVAEGATQNLFLVLKGELVTPAATSGILEGITRQTVIDLAQRCLGLPTVERDVDRTEIYQATEAFFCGTGQEIAPIIKVDDIPIGNGVAGETTLALKTNYSDVVRGRIPEFADWLTPAL